MLEVNAQTQTTTATLAVISAAMHAGVSLIRRKACSNMTSWGKTIACQTKGLNAQPCPLKPVIGIYIVSMIR